MLHRYTTWVFASIIAGLMFAVISCAKVGAPPGGPEDKSGPSVIENYPVGNTVSVSRRMTARLVFSERVNKASVEAALFLSPDPRERVRYHWSGDALELVFLDSLDQDRTYVISVGSQAKDLHGNPMGITFTVAFSTGIRIDHGSISGWIADAAAPQAVSLWAYRLDESAAVDLFQTFAQYRLQAGSDGRFRFDYMKAGRYRVFAVLDRNLDGLWNPPAELIATPPWDVEVGDSLSPWVSFRLSEQDTAAARIQSIKMIHSQQVDVRLNRSVTGLSASFVSKEGDTVSILDAYADSSGGDLWHVFPSKTLEPGQWTVMGRGGDPFGASWQDSDTVQIRERADTTRPHIWSLVPADKATLNIAPETLRVEFDEPIRTDSVTQNSFTFVAADTDTVILNVTSSAPRGVWLRPEKSIQAGTRYKLLLDGKSFCDAAGNVLSDSSLSFHFYILPVDSLGTLVGDLSTDTPGQYLFRVLDIRKHFEISRVSAAAPGLFRVDRLAAGKYLLEMTGDLDGNGVYTFGRVVPFSFSEPYMLSSDTVTVRARWEYETRVIWKRNP